MPDYQSYPLWWSGGSEVGNIDPVSLALGSETLYRLESWSEIYDATLNLDDPSVSGFPDEEKEKTFEIEGINLWKQIQKELGEEFEVSYYSYRMQKLLKHPDEFELELSP